MPGVTDSPNPIKRQQSAEIADHVAAFLAKGGKIEVEEIKARTGDEFQPRHTSGQKMITINPEKMRKRQQQEWKEGELK